MTVNTEINPSAVREGDCIVLTGLRRHDWDDPTIEEMYGMPAKVLGVALPYLAVEYSAMLDPHIKKIDTTKWRITKCSGQFFRLFRSKAKQIQKTQQSKSNETADPRQDVVYRCPLCRQGTFSHERCHWGEVHVVCNHCGCGAVPAERLLHLDDGGDAVPEASE